MCGFSQSILATVPETVTGRLPSYSAANEWCAASEAVPARRPQATRTAALMVRPSGVSTRRPHCTPSGRAGVLRGRHLEDARDLVDVLADEELVDRPGRRCHLDGRPPSGGPARV